METPREITHAISQKSRPFSTRQAYKKKLENFFSYKACLVVHFLTYFLKNMRASEASELYRGENGEAVFVRERSERLL